MNIWDLGGQHKIRRLWHHYFEQCDGIIFVIDSTDTERLKDDKSTETVDHEIKYLTTVNSLRGVPILFLANKYDCSKAKTAHEITKILNLSSLTNRKWYCLSTSALSGDGIYEGIDWLANMINDRH
jgi:GTPase SAR1 family protein